MVLGDICGRHSERIDLDQVGTWKEVKTKQAVGMVKYLPKEKEKLRDEEIIMKCCSHPIKASPCALENWRGVPSTFSLCSTKDLLKLFRLWFTLQSLQLTTLNNNSRLITILFRLNLLVLLIVYSVL